jgi:prepilin peptidase CpaA
MLMGFGLYFVLYCLHAMGAGDVKLMAAVGTILGPSSWISVFVASALVGAAFALAVIVTKRRLQETLLNTGYILYELLHFRPPFLRRSQLDVRHEGALTMPHGVAIATGTVLCLIFSRLA